MAVPFYSPIGSVWGFQFLHILANTCSFFILLKYNWFAMLISAVEQSDSVICIYIYTHTHSFSYSFPLWFITGYRIEFPVLYSRTLLFIHSIHNSLCYLIFYLLLVWNSLIMMYLDRVFLMFLMLQVFWPFWICGLMFSSDLEKFLLLVLQIFFMSSTLETISMLC